MKLNQLSSEYSLTDTEGEVIGVAKVTKKEDDSSLELGLGKELYFASREEVVAFLEQIMNVME